MKKAIKNIFLQFAAFFPVHMLHAQGKLPAEIHIKNAKSVVE